MIRTLCLATLALAGSLFADPRQWDEDGLPVYNPREIVDFAEDTRPDGTTLVVWAQSVGAEQVVLGQLFAPNGTMQWPEGGLLVAQGERKASYPEVVAVDGGWVIAWGDMMMIAGSGPNAGWDGYGTLRVLKIDDSGTPLWTGGRGGREIGPPIHGWGQNSQFVFPSGSGAIVVWRNMDKWAQRFDGNGEVMWSEPVRLRSQVLENGSDVGGDGDGGVFVMHTASQGLFVNRLLADGHFAWNDTVGVQLATGTDYFRFKYVCADGNDGAFVVWSNGGATRHKAQRLNASGELLWNAQGVEVYVGELELGISDVAPSVDEDATDGVLVSIRQWYNEPQQALIQKIALDGTRVWGDQGTVLCEDELLDADFSTIRGRSDGDGGAIAAISLRNWSTGHSLHLQRVGADNGRPWGDDCGVVLDSLPSVNGATWKTPIPILVGDEIELRWLNRVDISSTLKFQHAALDDGEMEFESPRSFGVGDHRVAQDVQVVALANGSTATVWELIGINSRELWYQIHDAFGTPLFETGGRQLVETAPSFYDELGKLAPDGSGGFFCAYLQQSNMVQLHLLHRDGNGNPVGDPDGELIDYPNVMEVAQWDLHLIADDAGGAYVAASHYNQEFILDTYIMRLNAECQPVWDQPVVRHGTAMWADTYAKLLAPAANHSVLVVYAHQFFPYTTAYVMRVRSDGTVAWEVQTLDSVEVSSSSLTACADNLGGVIVAWSERSDDEIYGAVAVRIGPAGVRMWGDGIALADSDYVQRISCGADALGNVTFAWEEYNGNNDDIYAQRVNAAGTALWQEGGLPLAVAPQDQWAPQVHVMSDNEVYVLWEDHRNAGQLYWNRDIYAAHLNARGQLGGDSYWVEGGSAVCDYEYLQARYSAVNDGAGGLTVAWLDQRAVFGPDHGVYLQRIYDPIFTEADDAPVVPSEFALAQNYPNPFNPETVIEFSLPRASETSLKVFDVLGREVATLVNAPMETGVHRVTFDASALASGVYFYRVEAGEFRAVRKMVLLK